MKASLATALSFLTLGSSASALDLIPFGSTWDYMQRLDDADPSDADPNFYSTWHLPTTEFNADYDGPAFGADPALPGPAINSGSGSAPLGYGLVNFVEDSLGGLGTVLTTPEPTMRRAAYFRTNFTTTTDVDNLALEIIADDGAVVYLDGELLTPVNYAGEDVFDGLSILVGNESAPSLILGGLGGLAAGEHTLAVSVHQASSSSSDLALDLRLSDDGFPLAPLGSTIFGGNTNRIFASGDATEWVSSAENRHSLTGLTSTLTSERIDITGLGELLLTATLLADDGSFISNFEVDDTLSARIELDSGDPNDTTSISLVPFGIDTNGDGLIGGEEFSPGSDLSVQVSFARPVIARIPAGFTGATLIVEGTSNSLSETFAIESLVITEAPTSIPLGSILAGTPADITTISELVEWEDTLPKSFTMNGAFEPEAIVSGIFDISEIPRAEVNLLIEFSETSSGSNFELSDTFQAWVQTLDAEGRGSLQEMVIGGLDLNGDNIIDGTEIAPGVDDSVEINVAVPLAVRLPEGAVSAQLFIAASNNSGSETFILSNINVVAAAPDFGITDILRTGTTVSITFESEAGATYQLQFSPDLSPGSFTTVETIVPTAASTTLTHDPGTPLRGFYRVNRLP